MIELRIEKKPAFRVVGAKTWISGQDNDQFGVFWNEAEKSGLIAKLHSVMSDVGESVTKSGVFGISCVEKNPDDRAFYFYIAAESDKETDGLEAYTVPECEWAIFRNHGDLPMSLVNAEMYAFMEWLPSSPYKHALAPELEVYPAADATSVEYWLPIVKK